MAPGQKTATQSLWVQWGPAFHILPGGGDVTSRPAPVAEVSKFAAQWVRRAPPTALRSRVVF